MAGTSRTSRVRQPLMGAFRSAFESRDARTTIDRRDEAGERILAGRRSTGRAAISDAELQRAVAHDLDMLMNTVNLHATLDLSDYEHVGRSVVNFGFPDLVHRTIDEISLRDVADEIATVLRSFEPRLARESIDVARDTRADPTALKIRFVVRAELQCEPLNVPIEFLADLERDTGKITITRP